MKTLKILLAVSLVSAAPLSAEEGMFKLAAKVVVLPTKEFPAQPKMDGLIADGEMHSFLRKISKIDNARMALTPSVVVKLNKAQEMEIVSEKTVIRIGTANAENIGYTITYRLESIDGVFTLEGIFKHSEISDGEDPSVVAIETKEIIFKRNCEVDKSILVSNGDTHIFVTLTRWKEE